MKRRYLAMLLCFVLCFGLFAMPAAAEEAAETALETETALEGDTASEGEGETALPAFPSEIGVEVYEDLKYAVHYSSGGDHFAGSDKNGRYYAQVTGLEALEPGQVVRCRIMKGDTTINDGYGQCDDDGWQVLDESDKNQALYNPHMLPAGNYSIYFVVSTKDTEGNYTNVSQERVEPLTIQKREAVEGAVKLVPTENLTYNGADQKLLSSYSVDPSTTPAVDSYHDYLHYIVVNQKTFDEYGSDEVIRTEIDALESTGLDATNKWVNNGPAYATNPPKGTDAGTYYIYYRAGLADGTSCVKSYPTPLVVTIAKATPTVADQKITYGKTLGELVKAQGVLGEALEGIFAWTTAKGEAATDGTAVTDATILDVGTYTVGWTFTPTGGSAVNYEAVANGKATITVTAADIADADIELGDALSYTGAEQTQTVASVTLNGTTLVEGTDYTVSGNTGTEVGDHYTLTVTGKGNYTGTATADFSIAKASIAPEVSIESWTYGESAKDPSVTGNPGNGTVKYFYKEKDAEDSTYTAEAPTAVGEYIVKAEIAETANYKSGTAQTDFAVKGLEINLLKFTIGKQLTYTGAALTPTVTIKAATVDGSEYTIAYSADGETYSADIPTYTEAGTHRLYVKLSAANHEDLEFYDEFEIKAATKPAQAPRTGDSATPILWIVIIVIAIAAVVVLLVVRKKRK